MEVLLVGERKIERDKETRWWSRRNEKERGNEKEERIKGRRRRNRRRRKKDLVEREHHNDPEWSWSGKLSGTGESEKEGNGVEGWCGGGSL